jgi:nucleoside-diphosphate-sugar epimerase
MSIRVAVIGGTGFLGRNICRRLEEEPGVEVFRPSSPSEGGPDIIDPESIGRYLQSVRPDVVVNAAGIAHVSEEVDSAHSFDVNAQGPANVVRGAHESGCRLVIHLSSVLVYARSAASVVDETSGLSPEGLYAESKALGEELARSEADRAGMSLVVLRLAVVPQAGVYGNLAELVSAVGTRRFLWVGDGGNLKSLLSIRDLANAVIEVVRRPDASNSGCSTYNLANPPVTMKALVERIAETQGVGIPRWKVPRWLALTVSHLAGGVFGIPEPRRILRFLESDVYSARRFADDFDFAFAGDPLSELADALGKTVER